MFRFAVGFLISVFSLIVCAQPREMKKESNLIVVPIDRLSSTKSYSKLELGQIYTDFYKSNKGSNFWGELQGNKGGYLYQGSSHPASVTGAAKDDYAAGCYRCALGRSDLVTETDCKEEGLAWNVKNIEMIKKHCH